MLRTVLVVLVLVASALSDLTPDAGLRIGRIAGGQLAAPGQFPYQAYLRTIFNSHICGGFIITARTVGSSGHCAIRRAPSNTVVVVGTNSRLVGGTSYEVQSIAVHPQYTSRPLTYDISVLITSTPIVFSTLVTSIPLSPDFFSSGTAVVAGWGQLSRWSSKALELRYLTQNVITNDECAMHVGPSQIDESILCAKSLITQGLCIGDAGGPLVANGSVIGVASWGIACARGKPDMYARISVVNSWLLTQIVN